MTPFNFPFCRFSLLQFLLLFLSRLEIRSLLQNRGSNLNSPHDLLSTTRNYMHGTKKDTREKNLGGTLLLTGDWEGGD